MGEPCLSGALANEGYRWSGIKVSSPLATNLTLRFLAFIQSTLTFRVKLPGKLL